MTKKDLIKWLGEQMGRTCDEVYDKMDEALKTYREKIIEDIGLNQVASEIQKKFNEIDDLLKTWKAGLDPNIVINDEYWGTTHRTVYPYIGAPDSTKNQLLSDDLRIGSSKAYQRIKKKYCDMQDNVRREYGNVIANVRTLKNARLGIEYLESLGFDLTELKEADDKPLSTALSVPINTEYLFIGGNES